MYESAKKMYISDLEFRSVDAALAGAAIRLDLKVSEVSLARVALKGGNFPGSSSRQKLSLRRPPDSRCPAPSQFLPRQCQGSP